MGRLLNPHHIRIYQAVHPTKREIVEEILICAFNSSSLDLRCLRREKIKLVGVFTYLSKLVSSAFESVTEALRNGYGMGHWRPSWPIEVIDLGAAGGTILSTWMGQRIRPRPAFEGWPRLRASSAFGTSCGVYSGSGPHFCGV